MSDLSWSEDDAAAAAKQGWRLDVVWDALWQRLEYDIAATDPSKDRAAREYVLQGGDKLRTKANRLVMQSKMGSLRPEKRKKK